MIILGEWDMFRGNPTFQDNDIKFETGVKNGTTLLKFKMFCTF